MKELIERLGLPSPALFKKVFLWILVTVASLDASIVTILQTMDGLLPEWGVGFLKGSLMIANLFGLLSLVVTKLPVDWDRTDAFRLKHVKAPKDVLQSQARRKYDTKKRDPASEDI